MLDGGLSIGSWFSVSSRACFCSAAGSGGRAGAPHAVSLGFYLAAYAFGGFFTLRDAVQSLWAKRFDIDTLMLVAAGAAALGDWAEGALLLFPVQPRARAGTFGDGPGATGDRSAGRLAPKTALVRRDGAEVEVPVEELLRGDKSSSNPASACRPTAMSSRAPRPWTSRQ